MQPVNRKERARNLAGFFLFQSLMQPSAALFDFLFTPSAFAHSPATQ